MSISSLWRRKQMQKPTAIPNNATPPPDVTPEAPRNNVVGVNEEQKFLEVRLYFNDEESIQKALGTLEISKDVVKGKMVQWRQNVARRNSILVPGNGRAH